MNLKSIFLFFIIISFLNNCSPNFTDEKRNFYSYKQKLYLKALKKDYPTDVIEKSFNIVKYSKKHVKKDRKQFSKKSSFNQYYNLHINQHKINKGRKKLKRYRSLLTEIEEKYQIPSQYIVALWGIESDFGNMMGNNYMVNSLANLAYEGRRREFFESEFFASLEIINKNNFQPKKLKSSWAGAVGQCQFMPSTYLNYAVDYNNNGKIDIWHDKADIFASTANYLAKINFNNKLPFGYEIKSNNELISYAKKNKDKKIPLEKLVKKFKIEKINNSNFSEYELKEKIEILSYDGRIFVNFQNFDVIKKWNNSNYFALTVGLFADAIKQN